MYYIFHGPDQFTAQETLNRLKTRLGEADIVDLNTAYLDGKTLALNDLIHHANALPFLAPKRLVIVTNYLLRLGGSGNAKGDVETMEKLAQVLDNLPETTNLVFLEDAELKKRHPILQKVLQVDKSVHAFLGPTGQQVPAWIEKRVGEKEGKIERPAVMALANVVGEDLRRLDNEVEKLLLYVNGERAINLADVELLCPYTADSETFAMANAIGRGNIHEAQNQLHKRLEEGQTPLGIMAGIVSQFRGLLEVKSMANQGLTPAKIAEVKGWRSDYAVKVRLREAGQFSHAQLIQIFNILRDADLAIKTGRIDQTLQLDTLIARLCRAK
ncbi:MAG: DNA polymerase III subunit delta [Chloroflexota bacterium]